jgi:hypothetical protein
MRRLPSGRELRACKTQGVLIFLRALWNLAERKTSAILGKVLNASNERRAQNSLSYCATA